MQNHTPNDNKIPYGYCHCGCGQKTRISKKTDSHKGHIAGKPIRFIVGHSVRVRTYPPAEERFWNKVDKRGPDDCWEWQAGSTIFGYGVFYPTAKTGTGAHRYSYQLHFGKIPKGKFVCHTCDNPACVNPSHLFLGDPVDNSKDMVAKGRHWVPSRRGKRNGHAKLTEETVKEIRRLRAIKVPEKEVAKMFNISVSQVSAIKRRKSWAHVL